MKEVNSTLKAEDLTVATDRIYALPEIAVCVGGIELRRISKEMEQAALGRLCQALEGREWNPAQQPSRHKA